jgi:hypothetical protein
MAEVLIAAEALSRHIKFLEDLANTLDDWAKQTMSGGWSTHQVEDNRRQADNVRREAAALRRIRER